MLNRSAQKEAEAKLKKSLDKHETLRQEVVKASVRLLDQQQRAVDEVIEPVENYVNRLAHSPEELVRSVSKFRIKIDRFKSTAQQIESAIDLIERKGRGSEKVTGASKVTGTTAGGLLAGTTFGSLLAAFGPTAAKAVAMTFGTASTGTPISALSGAAETNAALAWLGGGAKAAGGGGMAKGTARQNRMRSLGLNILVHTMVRGIYHSRRNLKDAKKADQCRFKVNKKILWLQEANREIRGLETSTRTQIAETLAVLGWIDENAPNDYQKFTPEQKERLAALINHIRSLSELLRKEIAL